VSLCSAAGATTTSMLQRSMYAGMDWTPSAARCRAAGSISAVTWGMQQ